MAATADIRELAGRVAAALSSAGVRQESIPSSVTTHQTEAYGFLGRKTRMIAVEQIEMIPFGWQIWQQIRSDSIRKTPPESPYYVKQSFEELWLTPDGQLAFIERETASEPWPSDSVTHRPARDDDLAHPEFQWMCTDLPLADLFLERQEWESRGMQPPTGSPTYEPLRQSLEQLLTRARAA